MTTRPVKKLHNAYRQTVQSIAFYPALICVAFIGASFLLLGYDDSESGKQLKAGLKWLRLRDADTARAIVSAVVTGLLTVTVFSFTMVMVVLTQAASHLSNRVLDSLIRNRYQQVVLGFFVGTIVFGLLLLASIRDSDSGVTIPAISTYALIAFTITDMFLFIYFLHFVTQSVRYQTIIRRIAADTQKAMAASCRLNAPPATEEAPDGGIPVSARGPGIYQGIERGALLELCRNRKLSLSFTVPPGSYVLTHTPLFVVHGTEEVSDELANELLGAVRVEPDQSVETNYHYGFNQLTEIAVKALSPGVNDPATAVQALRALASLLAFRLRHFPESAVRDGGQHVRLLVREYTFDEIFTSSILPVWDYGRNDRIVQQAMIELLSQLYAEHPEAVINSLLRKVQAQAVERERV